MAHFIPTRLYFIITGFILTLSQDDCYGLIEVYYNYIYQSKVSSSSYVAVASVCMNGWTVDKKLLITTHLCQATTYVKPKQVIHCCVEHLLLMVLICNTYCVELPRAEGNRFSTVSKISPICNFVGFFKVWPRQRLILMNYLYTSTGIKQ